MTTITHQGDVGIVSFGHRLFWLTLSYAMKMGPDSGRAASLMFSSPMACTCCTFLISSEKSYSSRSHDRLVVVRWRLLKGQQQVGGKCRYGTEFADGRPG